MIEKFRYSYKCVSLIFEVFYDDRYGFDTGGIDIMHQYNAIFFGIFCDRFYSVIDISISPIIWINIPKYCWSFEDILYATIGKSIWWTIYTRELSCGVMYEFFCCVSISDELTRSHLSICSMLEAMGSYFMSLILHTLEYSFFSRNILSNYKKCGMNIIFL